MDSDEAQDIMERMDSAYRFWLNVIYTDDVSDDAVQDALAHLEAEIERIRSVYGLEE